MNIQHQQDSKSGSFYYENDGVKLALMAYVWAGDDKIIVDHTEVDDSLKGQGVGKKLLEALVHFVRERHVKVIPLCPFANNALKKEKEWHDVLLQ
ncbi:N-acetyltransferase [Olivibacter sp. SDN3]|uniref:GNAT family N-acetyltransferase n=1 Tax=Olivibacter sp. SDN3 TaxID=2764720 RepID=UPI0016517995|nr:GNAT family N-acetyltransferase [Olivibacter sp. SDN3]QNL49910.1 N-acetyltransferase [Olivibacter sp. SDN3]